MSVETNNSANHFEVILVTPERIALLKPPKRPLSKREALNLAAWLVALADDRRGAPDGEFARTLQSIRRS